MKPFNLLVLITILLTLTTTLSSLKIHPDNTNPLLINKPNNNNKGYKLSLMFSLDTQSIGLNLNQFFGVIFPKKLGPVDLFLNSFVGSTSVASTNTFNSSNTNIARYACDLLNITDNYTIKVSASPTSSSTENNIAYCKLTDTQYKLVPNKTYKLTITLTEIQLLSSLFIPTIGLLTSTDNSPEKIIIDNLPVIGSLGQYISWTENTVPALEISNVEIKIISGIGVETGSNALYPYNTFDVKVLVKVKSFISHI